MPNRPGVGGPPWNVTSDSSSGDTTCRALEGEGLGLGLGLGPAEVCCSDSGSGSGDVNPVVDTFLPPCVGLGV